MGVLSASPNRARMSLSGQRRAPATRAHSVPTVALPLGALSDTQRVGPAACRGGPGHGFVPTAHQPACTRQRSCHHPPCPEGKFGIAFSAGLAGEQAVPKRGINGINVCLQAEPPVILSHHSLRSPEGQISRYFNDKAL